MFQREAGRPGSVEPHREDTSMSAPTEDEDLPPYGVDDEPEPVEVVEEVEEVPADRHAPDERSMFGGLPRWVLWVVLGGLVLVVAIVAGALSGSFPGTGDDGTGEVQGEAEVQDQVADVEPGEETSGTVCVEAANVRSGPSTDDEVVTTLAEGDEVLFTVVEGTDGWVQLVGSESWLSTDLLCEE